MIEFALVAPLFLLIAMGLIVTGVVVTHQVQLTNLARDAARGLAVCGSAVAPTSSSIVTNVTLPDGTSCKTNESTYAANVVQQVNAKATIVSIQVVTIASDGTVSPVVPNTGDTTNCESPAVSGLLGQQTRFVQVKAQYSQPLFLPLVGTFLGTGGTSNRTLNATAVAQCEQ